MAIRAVPRRYVDENCGDQISGRGATWRSEKICGVHFSGFKGNFTEHLNISW